MRGLASGKNVTTFTVASNEFLGGGKEKAEYQSMVKVYLARQYCNKTQRDRVARLTLGMNRASRGGSFGCRPLT